MRTLAVREAKGGHARHITLTDEGPELFDRLVAGRSSTDYLFCRDDGTPWKSSQQGRMMQHACAEAGVYPEVGFHVLRHTYASLLAMRGVPMGVIAKQLGHADTRMTEKHYAHLAPNYIAETIRANFPRLVTADPLAAGNVGP